MIFLWKDNMNRIIDAAFRTYAKEERLYITSGEGDSCDIFVEGQYE